MLTRPSRFLLVGVIGVLGFAGTMVTPLPLTAQAAPAPVLTFPQGLVEWSVAGGFIYLSDTCTDASTQTTAYLKRRAINGPGLASLEDVAGKPQCRTFRHAATDDSGVYYYNRNLGRLEAIYSDAPYDPPTALATIGDWTAIGFGDGISTLRLDASYVYWIQTVLTGEFTPDQVAIKRVSKRGGVPVTLFSYSTASQTSFSGLGVTSQYIWWTDSNGLNRIDSCTTSLCAPGVPRVKTTEVPFASGGGIVQVSGSNIFWWSGDEMPEQIRRTSCHRITGTCSTSSFHTAASGITISGIAANSNAAYWVEVVPSVGRRLMRKALSGGSAETLVEGIHRAVPYLDVDGVYFQSDANTISRLPFDAEALSREIGIAGWEVTQGIQRLANDVPLVAGKTTYVRLYPTLEDGTDVGAATAALHGSTGGEPLPGSPIYPENVTIPIGAGLSLADRGDLDSGWLFRLPESWTRSGDGLIPQVDTTISLRAVIDPNRVYAGTDGVDNNEIMGEFLFVAKAPTCVTLRSVVTNNSYESTFGINVGQVVELTDAVLPTTNLIAFPKNDPLREIKWCWKGPVYGPFCSTPYELNDDDSMLLTKMGWIDYWADTPLVCRTNNARTLLAGVVHADAEWSWGGLARTGKDQLLTKVPKYGAAIDRRNGTAMTMVHEIGHSYDRRHIDCGDPLGPDSRYPYPPDMIDFDLPLDLPALHFGFDPLRREPIVPTTTSDYMSYCDPSWYSDYTWKALFNKTRDPIYVPPVTIASVDGDLVRISGQIDTIAGEGTLDYAWTLPSVAASVGQKERWNAERTGAWDGSAGSAPYHLQLIGADESVLIDQMVELSTTDDGDPADRVPFALAVSAPAAAVARLQLMANDSILDTLSVGTNPPINGIDQPAGGETIESEVSVRWTASDPDGDRLSHTIQYSPDGTAWYPLLANYGGTGAGTISHTLTLDLSGEAGSNGANALIRVLSSDGLNTAMAVSAPFSVARRAPSVTITQPLADHTYRADETLSLHGLATDPEDGLVADDRFVWSTGHTGRTAEVHGLAPGRHEIQLSAEDLDGLAGTGDVSFTVAPLAVTETASAPVLDGYCDDAAYRDASMLPLSRYADGSRASAQIIHSSSALWLCLSNLHEIDGYAGLLVDADNSRDALAQPEDFGYFVQRDGTGFVSEGNGSGFGRADAGDLSARITDNGAVWSAELRIYKRAFGSWQQRVSLAMGHFAQTGEQVAAWPRSADRVSPLSWGQTNFGLVAELTTLEPESAVLGSGDISLTVGGANFGSEHVVLWNGTPVSTTLVDAGALTVVVPSGSVVSAGTYHVAVGVTGAVGLETAASPFVVNNVRPTISGLMPDTVEAGAGAASGGTGIAVTIEGTGFVTGATVMWDGEPRATTRVGPTQLRIDITADELAYARTIPIIVQNPQPVLGPSTAAVFTIAPVVTPTAPVPTATPSPTGRPPTVTPLPTTATSPTGTPLPTPTVEPGSTPVPDMHNIWLPLVMQTASF